MVYYAVAAGAAGVWHMAVAQVLNACFISAVMGLGISYFQDLLPAYPGQATTMFTNTNRISAMLAGPISAWSCTSGTGWPTVSPPRCA